MTCPSILAIAMASPITIFRKAWELRNYKVAALKDVPMSEQKLLSTTQRKKVCTIAERKRSWKSWKHLNPTIWLKTGRMGNPCSPSTSLPVCVHVTTYETSCHAKLHQHHLLHQSSVVWVLKLHFCIAQLSRQSMQSLRSHNPPRIPNVRVHPSPLMKARMREK